MKRIFKVETNASTMFATYDYDEQIVRLLDNKETNSGMDIREVEDDSSWEMFEDVEDIEEFLGISYTDCDANKIVDEAEIRRK